MKYIFILLISILLFSCSKNKVQETDKIIKKDTLLNIKLFDENSNSPYLYESLIEYMISGSSTINIDKGTDEYNIDIEIKQNPYIGDISDIFTKGKAYIIQNNIELFKLDSINNKLVSETFEEKIDKRIRYYKHYFSPYKNKFIIDLSNVESKSYWLVVSDSSIYIPYQRRNKIYLHAIWSFDIKDYSANDYKFLENQINSELKNKQ